MRVKIWVEMLSLYTNFMCYLFHRLNQEVRQSNHLHPLSFCWVLTIWLVSDFWLYLLHLVRYSSLSFFLHELLSFALPVNTSKWINFFNVLLLLYWGEYLFLLGDYRDCRSRMCSYLLLFSLLFLSLSFDVGHFFTKGMCIFFCLEYQETPRAAMIWGGQSNIIIDGINMLPYFVI